MPFVSAAFPKLVRILNQTGLSRERWPFAFALFDVALDPLRNPQRFDRIYREKFDPWSYTRDTGELQRHRLAAQMLDGLALNRRFDSAVEIGCSEGIFTELLAVRSAELLAVDFSPVALQRARQRREWGADVSFRHYDLRRDPPPGSFELVVVMDVLTSFRRPGALRAARDKVVQCVRPGGYLLVTDHRQHPAFEKAWWARHLLHGGKWVVSAFAEHPLLAPVDGCRLDTHVLALFRRQENPA